MKQISFYFSSDIGKIIKNVSQNYKKVQNYHSPE